MISLGILSVIFTLIYGTFNAVSQGADHLEEEAEVYRLTRFGIYHMANNLSMVYFPNKAISPSPGKQTPGTFIGEDKMHLVNDKTLPNDSLAFNTVSHGQTLAEAPESDQARIKYALVDGILVQEMQLSNGKTLRYELGGPFQGLNFRYFDSKKKNWKDDWNTGAKGLPLAVEIEFFIQQKGRSLRRFKTWVDIPMAG